MIYLGIYALAGLAMILWVERARDKAIEECVKLKMDKTPPPYPMQLKIVTMLAWPLLLVPFVVLHVYYWQKGTR